MLPSDPSSTGSPAPELCSIPYRPIPGRSGSRIRAANFVWTYDAVQRTLSRIPGLDDLTRDIDGHVGFAIDPGIPRPVLPRDDERTAPTAPAVAAARQIPSKAGLNLQQVESDDG